MPTAIPTMPDSANGVSKQRVLPKRAVNPSVMRNTPPSTPTSSPKMTTDSSAVKASARAVFRALPKVTGWLAAALAAAAWAVSALTLPFTADAVAVMLGLLTG